MKVDAVDIPVRLVFTTWRKTFLSETNHVNVRTLARVTATHQHPHQTPCLATHGLTLAATVPLKDMIQSVLMTKQIIKMNATLVASKFNLHIFLWTKYMEHWMHVRYVVFYVKETFPLTRNYKTMATYIDERWNNVSCSKSCVV